MHSRIASRKGANEPASAPSYQRHPLHVSPVDCIATHWLLTVDSFADNTATRNALTTTRHLPFKKKRPFSNLVLLKASDKWTVAMGARTIARPTW